VAIQPVLFLKVVLIFLILFSIFESLICSSDDCLATGFVGTLTAPFTRGS